MKRDDGSWEGSACLLRCIPFMYVGPTGVYYRIVFGGDKGFVANYGRYLIDKLLLQININI